MKTVWCLISFSILGILKSVCAQCSHSIPCAFVGGADLVFPPEESSSGGTLAFTLNVDVTNYTIEWLTLHRRTYNGLIPGPTWRIRRGDVVTVTLNNLMTLPHKTQSLNQLRYPNATNLHTHGLHISSMEPQDDVFVHVNPTESYTYTYQIDAEQPAGTYWYHSHLHGATMLQVHGGLGGMLIVEDQVADMPAHLAAVSCPDNCQHDIILCFQPTMQYVNNANRGYAHLQNEIEDDDLFRHAQYTVDAGGTLEDWLTNTDNNIDYFTTNGQLWPQLNMTTGQTKRFRMVNAGGSANLELMITDVAGTSQTSACEYKEIAFDGVYLDAPRGVLKTLLVASGKADWLVVCNTPGTYELRSYPENVDRDSMGNFQRYDGVLLTLNVNGTGTGTIGTTLPARESFISDFQSYTDDQVYGRCVLEANPGTQMNREDFSSETHFRCQVEVDCVNEIYLTNSDPTTGHPIHIHVNHFQVISYNPYTGPYGSGGGGTSMLTFYDQSDQLCHHQHATFDSARATAVPSNPLRYLGHDNRYAAGGAGTLGYAPVGDFRDVILVPPLANITVRFMSHTYTGEVVVHCHILSHEDLGMMLTFEIVNTGSCFNVQNTTANTLSGTAAPGQCRLCDPFPFNQDVAACLGLTTSTTNTTTTTTTTTATTTTTTSNTTTNTTSISSGKLRESHPISLGIFIVLFTALVFVIEEY